ncbi:MAG TPA: nitrile hydratase subunit alpha [Burkholderiales bacterium]|nr:nitrile hydratase subunit alpha [Burkholderiales bacterium]
MKQETGRYEPYNYFQLMEVSLRELLVAKGIVTEDAIAGAMAVMRARGPERGAAMVARAWADPAYKARLLENGSRAAEELGFEVPGLRLIVVENTPETHNAIVCTLCSCYPRILLGLPPEWYKSKPYRSRMVREPRKVLAEFGLKVPAKVQIRVHDSNADMRYMVLPMRPAATGGWDEARLAGLVTRDCLIGVAVPTLPKIPKKPKPRKS